MTFVLLVTLHINALCNGFFNAKSSVFISHDSENRRLCLMKWRSKMIQNLPYFLNMKTHGHSICMYIVFYHFLLFFPNKCLGLCWHRFSYSKNMTNFETFTKVISSSISLFFADEWNRYVLLIRLNQIFQYFSFVRWQQNCWPIEVTQPQGQFFQVDLLGNNISIAPKNKFGSIVKKRKFYL